MNLRVSRSYNKKRAEKNMDDFDAVTEVAKLKQLAETIKHRRKSSRLIRYKSQLLAMHQAGATTANLQRWLKSKHLNVVHSTGSRWLKKNTINNG
ncbi:hypothetical protein CI610_02898 [invertebrate metagenome]|uniref:Uncharacterized protein n=1 Tax=invertebrate metagenome TaxID=1711999 RepID=A0A2H9T4N8_9ZZZZ